MSKREYRTVEDDIIPKYMRALNDKFKLRSEVTILKLDVPKQQYLIDKFTVQLEEKKRLLEELEGEIAKVHGEVEQIEKARSKNLSKFDNSLKGVEDVEIALVEQARQLRHTLKIRTYITSVLIVILIFFALR